MQPLADPPNVEEGVTEAPVGGSAVCERARLTRAVALYLRLQAQLTRAEARCAQEHHRALVPHDYLQRAEAKRLIGERRAIIARMQEDLLRP